MRSHQAREYFISNQIVKSSNSDLSRQLDNLTLFSNTTLDLKGFNTELSKIIDWNKINNIKYMIENDKHPENLEFILNIHAWSKKTFRSSLHNGNIDKLIISYLIGYYLFLDPCSDFQWDNKMDKIQKNLEGLMQKTTTRVNIPPNASYSDKKYYNDYKTNSYKKVFDFLTAIDRSGSYDHYFSDFIYAVAAICMKINTLLISNNIGKYEPILIKLFLNCLSPHETVNVLDKYLDASLFPLLIGLIHVINPSGNNRYDESLENDKLLIDSSSKIIQKISERIDTIDLYNFITECSNISGNKLWHAIFIAFGVRNKEYLGSYVDNIDFSYDFSAENVFDIFCDFMPNEAILDDFSVILYNKFLDFVLKKRNYEYSFCGTTYLKFMIHAVYVLSNKSCIQYEIMLKKISIDFYRSLYSWKNNEISIHFTKLIFWILALSYYINDSDLDNIDTKYTISFFENEKYLNIFNKQLEKTAIDYRVFADFLENPKNHVVINLPLSHNAYTIVEFNKGQE